MSRSPEATGSSCTCLAPLRSGRGVGSAQGEGSEPSPRGRAQRSPVKPDRRRPGGAACLHRDTVRKRSRRVWVSCRPVAQPERDAWTSSSLRLDWVFSRGCLLLPLPSFTKPRASVCDIQREEAIGQKTIMSTLWIYRTPSGRKPVYV